MPSRSAKKYLALETRGTRHNLGVKFGVVEAQIALALAGPDRERMLALLLESVAKVEQGGGEMVKTAP
jgi:UTP--glucose-1-phosphate uridylyltransferase